MKDKAGKPVSNTTSSMNVYMKQPNLCKMMIDKPVKSIAVQKDNVISIKMENNPKVIRQRVNEYTNMLSKYLQLSDEAILGNDTVESDKSYMKAA
jgi:outer membrane lipoprotein-sorting protein